MIFATLEPNLFGPAHELLVLTPYAKKPNLKNHADVSRGVKGLIFGLSLPLLPYFDTRNKASDKDALMDRFF